jgi:transposase-like protein
MKRKRYSVEQIITAVKQHEAGATVADICRKLGIAEGTISRCNQPSLVGCGTKTGSPSERWNSED